MTFIVPLFAMVLLSHQRVVAEPKAQTSIERRDAVLNDLRDQINAHYGFRESVPRVNLGPCGRFARDFREQWNGRFDEKIHIAFVMAKDDSQCFHVVIKLPDGNYYDGGNGVMTQEKLLSLFSNSRIDEMTDFDIKLLDKRSYGLGREYPVCPNYSDDTTGRIIKNCLAKLPNGHRDPHP
jgi:hypothetical protein